jgi:hypothetical protein
VYIYTRMLAGEGGPYAAGVGAVKQPANEAARTFRGMSNFLKFVMYNQ